MEVKQKIIDKELQRLKKSFLTKREKIKIDFLKQNKAINCCKANSKLIDELIVEIYKSKIKYQIEPNVIFCICAVGGYGRELLAPHSDLDLLFLFQKNVSQESKKKLVELFLFPLWDLGLNIGYAVRNVEESIKLSRKDHVIQTSMLDARNICGSKILFNELQKNFRADIVKYGDKLLRNKLDERNKRVIEVGYDYFKNEPNLKESEGSLRDINLIFWGINIFKMLNANDFKTSSDLLSIKEKKTLRSSLEFLLLLRCHLHYLSERANDKLSFDFQISISRLIYKIPKKIAVKDQNFYVEKMIKNYFRSIRDTKNLTEIFTQIIEKLLKNKIKQIELNTLKVKHEFKLEAYLKKVDKGIENGNDRRLAFENINKLAKKEIFTEKNIKLFRKIFFSLDKKKFVNLYEIGIVSKLIPEFSKISDLPQFDRFHSLSVGQHTIKALNILKDLEKGEMVNKNYSFSFNEIKKNLNRRSLFYAALLHDIGKGKGGEHNKKGKEISKKIVLRLGENITVAKQTAKLVYNHSLLSDVAFKQDFEDHSVIRHVTQKIKNIPFLRSLFILTVTDISAVDQGLWNSWKATLLSKLFLKIEKQIRKPVKVTSLNIKISKIQQNIVKSSRKITKSRMSEISKISYPNYWLLQSEKMITYQIETFLLNENINFDYVIRKFSNTSFFDIIIVTKDRPGLFLNLISIFVSEDLSIYESRIFTLDNGTVIDTFKLSFNQNRKYSKYDAKNSFKSLNQKIRDLGKGLEFKLKGEIKSKIKFLENKADVEIDNISSATYSILIVKTNNRPRLLYDISKILLKNKIIISMAKISTNGDFVEDSFHLRSEYGSKIQNEITITNLKTEIQNKLNQNLSNAI